MRILFTTDQIHLHGGIEKVMAEKANWFADVSGHEVIILTTEQNRLPACYPLSSKIVLKDIAINYNRKKSYFHPKNLRKLPFHFRQWKKAIKEINPDVLISCNYAFDFYWIPFYFKNLPKIKEFHSSRYFENKKRKEVGFLKGIKYRINDFIESRFTKLVVLNTDEIPFYKCSNLAVIPNPVKATGTQKASLTNKKVIAAGRITPIKGFDTMISVWKEVVYKSPDWELHIYGQGEAMYINELQNKISTLNLDGNVFIHPATSRLRDEMLDSSMYLMTSNTECYPMVLIEALSVGLPVITFDAPTGPRHIVKNNSTGFVTPYQNIQAITEKILLLIQNNDLRKEFGTNALQDSLSFQLEQVMHYWEELFNKLKNKF
jgi:glycosyltransferase involved in cell wall biosynthesis